MSNPDSQSDDAIDKLWDSMSEAIASIKLEHPNIGEYSLFDLTPDDSSDDYGYQLLQKLDKIIAAHVAAECQREKQVTQLKADIRYHTLKAKYKRMFLGGDEDALPTKRYVKSLKRQLAALSTPPEGENQTWRKQV